MPPRVLVHRPGRGGSPWEAGKLLDHNIELARRIADPRQVALACMHARSLDQPDRPNLAEVVLWEGRKRAERGDHVEALAHLDRALALMTELERGFDRAQVLDALGDVHAASDSAAARTCYEHAAQLYEEGGHLLAAAATQDRIAALS